MAHTWATAQDSAAFIAYAEDVPGGMTRGFLDSDARCEAFLGAMWVAPEYRGRGVGKGLVDAVRKWAIAQGAGVLKAWVSESNDGAREFYERLGFEATGI